jgi:hypothetical protein
MAVLALPMNGFAGVHVYAQGAYTADELDVYIYADIDGGTVLRSAGVKLTYNDAELDVTSAVKNDTVWAIGSEAYMDPDTSTGGEVVFILGKLDTGAPTEGVSGTRVLLGTVTFSRAGGTTDFGVVLSLGKTGDFSNFVDTGDPAAVLDLSVTFDSEIHERGDANGDGNINGADYVAVRNHLGSDDFPPWVDCNDDGSINGADYVCVRNKR